jgi:hypothetical protein
VQRSHRDGVVAASLPSIVRLQSAFPLVAYTNPVPN